MSETVARVQIFQDHTMQYRSATRNSDNHFLDASEDSWGSEPAAMAAAQANYPGAEVYVDHQNLDDIILPAPTDKRDPLEPVD